MEAARGATVLIHEVRPHPDWAGLTQRCMLSSEASHSDVSATEGVRAHRQAIFDDELLSEAVAKRHSLTREAIACGRDAGAYRTILTHFSQVLHLQ